MYRLLILLAVVACDVKGGAGSTPDPDAGSDVIDDGVCDIYSPYAGCVATVVEEDDTFVPYAWSKVYYDDLGREVERERYSDAAMTDLNYVRVQVWDGFRLTSTEMIHADDSISREVRTYDSKGRLIREDNLRGDYTTYAYNDPEGRLSSYTRVFLGYTTNCTRTWTDSDPSASYVDSCDDDTSETVRLDDQDLVVFKGHGGGEWEYGYRDDCQETHMIYSDLRWGVPDVMRSVAAYDSAGRIVRKYWEGGPAVWLESTYTYTCGGIH
jgi:hypothetical protein